MRPVSRQRVRSGPALITVLALLVMDLTVVPQHANASSATLSVIEAHPRLMADESQLSGLSEMSLSDATASRLGKTVVGVANAALTQPVIARVSSNGSLLGAANTFTDRVYALTVAWHLTSDAAYLERLWLDVESVSTFSDWNPNHPLDTAEFAHGMAIAYDWAYSYWSSARRNTMVNAILTLGLTPAVAQYTAASVPVPPASWVTESNNRNVIINSGIGVAALAISNDTTSTLPGVALTYATNSIRRGLGAFAADAGYPEGPLYWEYATRYLTIFLNSLQSATGHTDGLKDLAGLESTGNYILDMRGPTGQLFTYSDSDLAVYPAAALSGLGRLYGNATYEGHAAADTTTRYSPLRLVLRNPSVAPQASRAPGTPRKSVYESSGVGTLRSDWTDSNANFTALRFGGSAAVGHRHLDVGDFTLQSNGQVWATQADKEPFSYNLPPAASRWSLYRLRPEGHNTLVISPGTTNAYAPTGEGALANSGSDADGSFLVGEFNGIYPTEVTSWKRGVRVLDYGEQTLVQDEVTATGTITAEWRMHTQAAIEITEGGRSAVLTQGGQTMLARIASPNDATFAVSAAVPYPTTPSVEQSSNPGTSVLTIPVVAEQSMSLLVQFTPLFDPRASPPPLTPLTPLTSWSADSGGSSDLASLTVNGAPIDGFDPARKAYTIPWDPTVPVPQVVATGAGGEPLGVSQASGTPGRAVINGARVTVKLAPGPIGISGATATGTYRGSVNSTFDGVESTGWSGRGQQSVTWSLNGPVDLKRVRILWTANSARSTHRELSVSADGATWESIDNSTYTRGSGWEEIALNSPSTTKVRLTAYGALNTPTAETVIREVTFLSTPHPVGTPSEPPVGTVTITNPPTHLAVDESAQLTWQVVDPSGAVVDATIHAHSSNPDVLSVSADGRLRALSPGIARIGITARSGPWQAQSGGYDVEVSDDTISTFTAVEDAYIEGGTSANANFGASTRLDVKAATPRSPSSGTRVRHALVKFDVTGVDLSAVDRAIFTVTGRLIDNEGGSQTRVDAYEVLSDWAESSVTFSTAPTLGRRLDSATASREDSTLSFDLTDYVRSLASSGVSSVSVALGGTVAIDEETFMTRFGSRESSTPPTLSLETVPLLPPPASAAATTTVRGSAANTIDGDPSSGWAGRTGSAVIWSFTRTELIRSIRTLWTTDSSRSVSYDVSVSTDGTQWTPAGSGQYAGNSGWAQLVLATSHSARFIRLSLTTSSSPGWQASLREVELYSTALN